MNSLQSEIDALRHELEFISEINDQIHVDMNLDDVLAQIIYIMRERVPMDSANLALLDDATQTMNIFPIDYRRICKKADYSQELINVIYQTRFPYQSDTWICECARLKKEIHYPVLPCQGLRSQELMLVEVLKLKGLLMLPVFLGDRTFGTLSFYSYSEPLTLTPEVFQFCRRLVKMVARAVENSNRYQELKQDRERIQNQNRELIRMNELILEKNRAIQKELALAKSIQLNLLPQKNPSFKGLTTTSFYRPMDLVGGDFFDFLEPEENQLGIFISDVSGHGVPAAFITSMIKMSLITSKQRPFSPSQILTDLNKSLLNHTAGNFVTACMLHIDLKKQVVRYSNAGHMASILINKKTKIIQEIHVRGKILGVFPSVLYEEKELQIQPGDRFILFTDGLTEEINAKEEMFGEKRFYQLIQSLCHLSPEELRDKIIQNIRDFHGDHDFNDDIALVIADIESSQDEE